MRIIVIAIAATVALALSPADVCAQREPVQHQKSAAPAEGRYDIVQSALFARATYRIDKYLGQIAELVERPDSTLTWQRIQRPAHPDGDPQVANKPNYQLFISGIANRHTYLININSGSTWVLVESKEGYRVWEPISRESGPPEGSW